jgi:hypothetical protein
MTNSLAPIPTGGRRSESARMNVGVHEFHSERSDRVRDGIRQFDRGAFARRAGERPPRGAGGGRSRLRG